MPTITIDCFHEQLPPVGPETTIVAIDVIRASTTAITGAALGLRIFPAGSIEASVRLAADLDRPLLAGELGGVKPYGFDLQNSPSEIARLHPCERPVVLLSTSGTRLIASATARGGSYVACLRNAAAQASRLEADGRDVLILGADSRGEFRVEDRLCAARIASRLLSNGYRAGDPDTEDIVSRLADAATEAILDGRSARYLRDTGQTDDLDFVVGHVDDLEDVFIVQHGALSAAARREA